MKTVSVSVCSLSVPCYNRCRYCLLSWDGHCRGASYEDCRDYAEGFRRWIRENRPDVDFQFYFAYSMEHPQLLETVNYMGQMGYIQGKFLQFDGMKFRTSKESQKLLAKLKARGVELVDFTFYGTRDYHDRFAARTGDFDYMMTLLAQTGECSLGAQISIPMTHENVGQLDELVGTVQAFGPRKISCMVPHAEGRGVLLDRVRFSQEDYEQLSPRVLAHFNRSHFRLESEWVTSDVIQEEQHRALTVVPTPENLDRLRSMAYEDVIAWLEKLDDDYHAAIPTAAELVRLYGDPTGGQFYSRRDLLLHYQRRYIADHSLDLYDIHDERQSFVRRV